jgi:hypothetical protein
LNGPEIAAMLSEETGRDVKSVCKFPDDFSQMVDAGQVQMEKWYAAGAVDFMRQVHDGRMGYIGSVRDDIPYLTGKPAMSFRAWIRENRDALLRILPT